MKRCGSCRHFTRNKSLKDTSGLCNILDARASEDGGTKCNHFKRVKFHRKEKALILDDRLTFENMVD